MRLKQEDIALLRMLDSEGGAAPATITEAPKTMFEFNLVSRLPSGALQLTKTGARALFQAECIEALEQTSAGRQPAMVNDVERWLTSSGFLHPVERSITARGKLWLASLTPDGAEGAEAQPARRDAA